MEQTPIRELKGKELQAMRKRLSELAMDLPKTLAAGLPPEVQQEYRDAEQSVIDARLDLPRDHSGGLCAY